MSAAARKDPLSRLGADVTVVRRGAGAGAGAVDPVRPLEEKYGSSE